MEVQQVATELQAAVVTNELQAAVGCSQRQLAWQLLFFYLFIISRDFCQSLALYTVYSLKKTQRSFRR